jgi:hypothetical protein
MNLFSTGMKPDMRVGCASPAAASVQVARGQRSVWVGIQFLFDLFRNRTA